MLHVLVVLSGLLPLLVLASTISCTREVVKTIVVTATPAGTPTLTAKELAYVEAITTQEAENVRLATVAAQQTVAAQPTSTPRPTPKPYYDLKVISFSWYTEYGYAIVEGFVENTSGKTLEQVEAVANFYDANGTPITSGSALIDYEPLLPGQQSPYKVMARYNPAMTKCAVEFKEFWGGTFKTDYSAIP